MLSFRSEAGTSADDPVPLRPRRASCARAAATMVVLAAAAVGASGCGEILEMEAHERRAQMAPPLSVVAGIAATKKASGLPSEPAIKGETKEVGPKRATYKGSDKFLAERETSPVFKVGGGRVSINFENAELREVVRVVLGETLKLNYVYDPRVQGTVNLRTTRPMEASAVLSMLETVLRMNNGALVRDGNVYKVVPAAEAVRGAAVEGPATPPQPGVPGYAVRVVPLAHIGAAQMAKLLEPFLPPEGLVRVDTDRNLLILAGNSIEMDNVLSTIDLFDVDWLAGRSVGIYRLENVAADEVAKDLDVVFGDNAQGPLAGLVRLVPIDRLNALIVVTSRKDYLAEVETWIQRLDRGTTTGLNLYVYYLQHGKAADIARILSDVFEQGDRGGRQAGAGGRVAPGRGEARIAEPVPRAGRPGINPPGAAGAAPAPNQLFQRNRFGNANQVQPRPPAAARPAPPAAAAPPPLLAARRGLDERSPFAETANIRIIADDVNNALLILATPDAYKMVEAAIRKLDIVPLQILVEATIVEVTLTDQLRYGVEWFFKNHVFDQNSGTAILSSGMTAALSGTFPGFNYLVQGPSGTPKVVLSALENVTHVKVISSPHIMIRDNQSAELEVGNQVPIVTQQQQSTAATANVVNNIQYRDTGVILDVTPHVNSGGSISLDVEQEVSAVESIDATNPTLTPVISQRRIKSSVVVQSGQTVVLGGLIEERQSDGNSGIPLLSRLPLVGPLFGGRSDDLTRTELLVMISPRVVRDAEDARRITDEIRRKLPELQPRDLALPVTPKPVSDAKPK